MINHIRTRATARLLPSAGRLTHGGNLGNQRYSPLSHINIDSVAVLKSVWRASLKSGISPRAGNRALSLTYDGVVCTVNGENDAFAVSVDSDAVLWEYRATVDPKVARPSGRRPPSIRNWDSSTSRRPIPARC